MSALSIQGEAAYRSLTDWQRFCLDMRWAGDLTDERVFNGRNYPEHAPTPREPTPAEEIVALTKRAADLRRSARYHALQARALRHKHGNGLDHLYVPGLRRIRAMHSLIVGERADLVREARHVRAA